MNQRDKILFWVSWILGFSVGFGSCALLYKLGGY